MPHPPKIPSPPLTARARYVLQYAYYLVSLGIWRLKTLPREVRRVLIGGLALLILTLLFMQFALPTITKYVNRPQPIPLVQTEEKSPYQYTATDKKSSFQTFIGEKRTNSPKVRVTFGALGADTQVDFVMQKINANLAKPVVSGNKVTYTDVRPNIDLSYETLTNGIKEDIILKKAMPGNSVTFDLTVHGSTPKRIAPDAYGSSFYDETGKEVFHFAKPFAIDATGARTDHVLLSIRKKETEDVYQATVIVNEKWLKDPGRVYPISIDPTIVRGTSTEFSAGTFNRIVDTGSGASPSLETYYQPLTTDQYTVGLWHMDEASGNVLDSSGNSATGTPTGTTVATGKIGNGRNLNGTSDYITVPENDQLDPKAITIEAWIKPVLQAGNFVNKGDNLGYRFRILGAAGTLQFLDRGGTNALTSVSSVPAGAWSHVAVTGDASGLKIYINGVLDASNTVAYGSPNTASNLIMGNFAGVSEWYSGSLDEVRISNIARTPEEIKLSASRRPYGVYTSDAIEMGTGVTGFNSIAWSELGVATGDGETLKDATGLVAQWNFNDTSGTTLTNNAGSCGASCNGTLTNFASTGSQDAAPLTGWTSANKRWGAGALMFDGADDYISVANQSSLNPTTISLETWFKTKSFASIQNIIDKRNAANTTVNYLMQVQTTGLVRFFATGIFDVYSTQALPLNEWVHLVMTYDGTTAKIYINGNLSNSVNYTGTLPVTADNPLLVCRHSVQATGLYCNGILDSTRIYSRALTAAEILSNYNATTLDIQTRTGATTDPNDGSWSAWAPATSETSILSLDADAANWAWDGLATYMPQTKGNESNIKQEGSGSLKLTTGSYPTDANTVGLWHLDETGGTGAYMKDSSANANHGTPTGTTLINGVSGKARSFNGSSDSIAVGSTGRPTNTFTFEAWFTVNSTHEIDAESTATTTGTSGQKYLFGAQGLTSPSSGTGLSVGTNGLSVYEHSDGYMPPLAVYSGTIPSGWNHVAVVYNSKKPSIYLNGALVRTGLTSPKTTVYAPIQIGGGSYGFHDGKIDEVRISNIARTGEAIAASYRSGRDHYLNRTISSTDLSTKTTLPFSIASDRPGTYLSATIGESLYVTGQPDGNTVGLWHLDDHVSGTSNSATGGTITYSGEYTIHTFTADGTFTPNGLLNTEYLIVGGGGGGGFGQGSIGAAGGGGGAGGLRTGSSIVGAGAFPVVVGGGGGGSGGDTTPGGTGGASSFNSIVSNGGGGGGVRNASATTGGSGGGGASKTSTTGAAGTAGQGNTGANGDGNVNAGGGGGASGAGSGRTGGAGTASSITGSAVTYAVGGQGGLYLDDGPAVNAVSAGANTGSGGGAGTSSYSSTRAGGAGGSGIVVVRYLTNNIVSNTKNSASSSYHGTLSGTTLTTGKVGKARSFTVATDYIDLGTGTIADNLANLTADAWVYPTAQTAGTHYRVFNKQHVLYVGQYANQVSFYMGDGSAWTITDMAGGTLNLNAWNHVAWVKSGTAYQVYINGQLAKSGTGAPATLGTNSNVNYIGTYNGSSQPWVGNLDEVRISNVAKTADEIRQAYEYGVGLRSHQITIDFGAKLDSANLITGSGDLSFTIDATYYGLAAKGSKLFLGDKVIVKENYNGTEYSAQGLVNAINTSTGATTVVSWDAGSTFPASGYTANASVFKWQREYMNLGGSLSTHRNATTTLSLQVTDGNEGRTIYLDDLRSGSGYLTTPGGSTITSPANAYLQFRVIQTTMDLGVSSSLGSATLDYVSLGPSAPTIGTATILSPTSIRWGFTDTASNETGFKVHTTTGTTTATCPTPNLTYCSETGLTPNTSYTRKVVAYNASGESPHSATVTKITTAAVPPAPLVTNRLATSVQIQVLGGTNPAATTLAVYKEAGPTCDGVGGTYVAANGSDNAQTAIWQTAATWGTVTVTGLIAENQYSFCAKARNADGIETAFSTTGAFNAGFIPIAGDFIVTGNTTCTNKYIDGWNPSRYVCGVDYDGVGRTSTNSAILTVESGVLTINANETYVAGEFALTGGSIALASGASLKPGTVLWIADADGDGYPQDDKIWYGRRPPFGRRKALMTTLSTIDCNDGDGGANVTCCTVATRYQDSDGDGYGNPNVSISACPTAGYVTNNTDCDDAQATVWINHAACYWDLDRDTYTAGNTSGKTCLNTATCALATKGSVGGGVAPTTYTAGQLKDSANGTDCYDADFATTNAELAYPGSTYCGTTHRGDSSFDYNCDGSSTSAAPCTAYDRTTVVSQSSYSQSTGSCKNNNMACGNGSDDTYAPATIACGAQGGTCTAWNARSGGSCSCNATGCGAPNYYKSCSASGVSSGGCSAITSGTQSCQ